MDLPAPPHGDRRILLANAIGGTPWDAKVRFLNPVFLGRLPDQVSGEPASPQATRTAKSEIRWTFPLMEFYSPPKPLPERNPGELIRSEKFDEYDLPPGVLVVRIPLSFALGQARRRSNFWRRPLS